MWGMMQETGDEEYILSLIPTHAIAFDSDIRRDDLLSVFWTLDRKISSYSSISTLHLNRPRREAAKITTRTFF